MSTSRLSLMALMVLLLLFPVAGEAQLAGAVEIPRTPWGRPAFQGVWTNSTLTPLERPAELFRRSNGSPLPRAGFCDRFASASTSASVPAISTARQPPRSFSVGSACPPDRALAVRLAPVQPPEHWARPGRTGWELSRSGLSRLNGLSPTRDARSTDFYHLMAQQLSLPAVALRRWFLD